MLLLLVHAVTFILCFHVTLPTQILKLTGKIFVQIIENRQGFCPQKSCLYGIRVDALHHVMEM